MKRTKIVFIIPGFRHKVSQKSYKDLAGRFRKAGYFVVSVSIEWRSTTIIDNLACFFKQYEKVMKQQPLTQSDVYIVGFSYGALIAFLAATKINIQGLMLCSLSPFFKEDLPKKIPTNSSFLEEKRYEVFSSLKTKEIAKKVKAKKIMMLYGEKESKKLINRTKSAFRAIGSKDKFLFSIKNTEHEIASKKYISAIHFATSFL